MVYLDALWGSEYNAENIWNIFKVYFYRGNHHSSELWEFRESLCIDCEPSPFTYIIISIHIQDSLVVIRHIQGT